MKRIYDNGELLIELAELYLKNNRLQSDLDYYRDNYFKKCEEVRTLESQNLAREESSKPNPTF